MTGPGELQWEKPRSLSEGEYAISKITQTEYLITY